jgi:hypothetical protein
MHDRGRTVLSVLAVSSAIALVLVFARLRVGLHDQVRSVPEALPAGLVAACGDRDAISACGPIAGSSHETVAATSSPSPRAR